MKDLAPCDVVVEAVIENYGSARLEIEVAAQGEGTLKVNGVQIAQVQSARSSRKALRDLKKIAARHMRRRTAVSTTH